jgi:hypothetical protein
MKKTLSWSLAAFGGAAAIALAQSTPAPQPTPAAGQSGLNPTMANGSGMQLSTGTVEDYEPGKTITIKVSRDEEVKLDLDAKVRVDGLVAVGSLAAVMWTGDGGKRRVTSITAAPGPGNSGMNELNSSYEKMSDPQHPKGTVTPGASTTSGPTILTPKAGSSTPRATPTPGKAPATTPTATP